MDETGAGICVTFQDVTELEHRTSEIRAAIETLATRERRPPDAAKVERFTARASTAVLAGILDTMAARPEFAEAM